MYSDQRCKAAFPLARHNRIQVRVADELKKAGKFVRKASVRDMRRDRYDRVMIPLGFRPCLQAVPTTRAMQYTLTC